MNYSEENRPQNQTLVEGVIVNPVLREDFDNTPNDDREPLEVKDWWGVPYIVVDGWNSENEETYEDYVKRVSDYEGFEIRSEAVFLADQEKARTAFFSSFPEGKRYDVRCLDGGAWDRSTFWGAFPTLQEAIELAKTRLPLSDSPESLIETLLSLTGNQNQSK